MNRFLRWLFGSDDECFYCGEPLRCGKNYHLCVLDLVEVDP